MNSSPFKIGGIWSHAQNRMTMGALAAHSREPFNNLAKASGSPASSTASVYPRNYEDAANPLVCRVFSLSGGEPRRFVPCQSG
jgi:hypothetical protein